MGTDVIVAVTGMTVVTVVTHATVVTNVIVAVVAVGTDVIVVVTVVTVVDRYVYPKIVFINFLIQVFIRFSFDTVLFTVFYPTLSKTGVGYYMEYPTPVSDRVG